MLTRVYNFFLTDFTSVFYLQLIYYPVSDITNKKYLEICYMKQNWSNIVINLRLGHFFHVSSNMYLWKWRCYLSFCVHVLFDGQHIDPIYISYWFYFIFMLLFSEKSIIFLVAFIRGFALIFIGNECFYYNHCFRYESLRLYIQFIRHVLIFIRHK